MLHLNHLFTLSTIPGVTTMRVQPRLSHARDPHLGILGSYPISPMKGDQASITAALMSVFLQIPSVRHQAIIPVPTTARPGQAHPQNSITSPSPPPARWEAGDRILHVGGGPRHINARTAMARRGSCARGVPSPASPDRLLVAGTVDDPVDAVGAAFATQALPGRLAGGEAGHQMPHQAQFDAVDV